MFKAYFVLVFRPEENMEQTQPFIRHGEFAASTPLLAECASVFEYLLARLSPAYYGCHVPHGDRSAVIVIPGLAGADGMMLEMYAFLHRLEYRPYYSGIGRVTECPNILSQRLDDTIRYAAEETGSRVHLIGHSLGGILARIAAVRNPGLVASALTLGSPFRGLVAHPIVFMLSDALRKSIWSENPRMSETCATSMCECEFGTLLSQPWPKSVFQTAVYSPCDGLVDWRFCLTGKPEIDVKVNASHLGMLWNPVVLAKIAERLALAQSHTN